MSRRKTSNCKKIGLENLDFSSSTSRFIGDYRVGA
jgi:hypothetical protein